MNQAPAIEPGVPADKPWDHYTGRQRGIFLFVLFLVGTSNYVDRNIISILLEPIKREFGTSDTMLGLLSGLSFAIFYATLGIPVARWADRGNRKLVITVSLVVWSAMTAVCGMAQSFWQLAAARIGVGAGEAGAIPPAHSLIADYYPPDRRGKALGFYMICGTAGYVLGLVLGGWIAQHYGWRAAFLVVGLPGLLLAVVTHFVLKEPRHDARFAIRPDDREPIWTTFRVLYGKPAYRNILGAMILYWFLAYGALVFTPSFMIRVHGVNTAEAGALFGISSAVGSVVGSLLGGSLADRLTRKDIAWVAWLPGWGLIAAMPLYQAAYLAPSLASMVALIFLAGVLIAGAVPPMFAALQIICGGSRRAMAVAIAFFFANLLGLGLGPLIAGWLSDLFAQSRGGGEGLRYALILVTTAFLPSGVFMLRAGRHLKVDAEE